MQPISRESLISNPKLNLHGILRIYLFVLIAVGLTGSLVSADPLQLDMFGQLVTSEKDNNGKENEKLTELPKEVLPGSTIEYVISAQNIEQGNLFDIDVIGQIPEGTGFLENTATEMPMFSIDGGKTFQFEPVTYTVVENDKEVEKIATPDMYSHIKWIIETLSNSDQPLFTYRVAVK